MIKWWAVILIVSAVAGTSRAQENDKIHALGRRVKLDPERREISDSLDEFDDAAALRFAGQLLLPTPPHGASGFQIAAGVLLERLASDRYENALADYRRILQDDEPSLATRPFREFRGSDGLTSRDPHALAHEWLARLPPSILERYQGSIDAEATRLLADGASARDPAPLRRLVRDFRASVQANAALALLGDLAFERGDFDQALEWWRRLISLPSHELANRRGGDPKSAAKGVDLVRVHAKQTLALIFAARPDAARETDAFGKLHPDSRGALAGRNDAYHATLSHWLNELRKAPEETVLEPWPTFAGAPSRNRALGKAPSDRLWIDGATWRVPLPSLDAKDLPPIWLSATRSLAIPATPFHPVIADGQILICDGQTVFSYDLLTGKLRFRAATAASGDDTKSSSDLAFSVSTAPGRAFARLGNRPGHPRPTRLVGIDLATPGHRLDRVLWNADANADADGLKAFFETDPLVVGERIYIGVVRQGDFGTARFLACFDFAGAQLWQAKVADFTDLDQQRPARQSLLVGSGSTIVWATHAGAAIAVDAWTGRRLWAFRYPAVESGPSPRGASSCLAADGRVYLAPVDSPNLYCLDADTGQSLWERPWTKGPTDIVAAPPAVSDIVDLLGVVEDRLIFTDRGRLQAIDARSGAKLDWQQPSMGKLPGHGRGLLAGRWVFWPTADPDVSWRAVTHAEGLLRDPESEPEYYELTTLRGLPAGNIVYGSGCLAVAGATELVVYVPAGQQLPQLERDPQAQFGPAKLYRLALAQIEAGRGADADATLAKLAAQAPMAEQTAWQNLIRERTAPAAPAKRLKLAMIETSQKVSPNTVPAASPNVSAAGKLTSAWGPVPGVALPIECSRDTPRDDLTAVLDGTEIAFLETRTGNELFRHERRVAGVDWLGRHGSTLLVAGRDGVEAFDLETRRPTWNFPAPDVAGARWRLIDDRPRHVVGPRRLDGFEIVGQTLTFFEEGGRGFALDPKTGTVVSTLGGNDIEPLAGSSLSQPTIAWRAAASAPRLELPSRIWSSEPQPVDFSEARRRRVRFQNGSHLRGESYGVTRLGSANDPETSLGLYRPLWPLSLTGAAAHVFGDESLYLALVPRNQGYELIRFERQPFRPSWILPASELREGFDVRAATWDERALYLVHAGELQARDLATGSLLWKRALPAASGPWKVERFGSDLIAWPQSHAGLPALAGPVDPIAQTLTLAFGRRGIGAVPILIVDVKAGTVKKRLDVPHDGGPVFANVQGTRLVVSAGGLVRAWSAVP